MLRVSLVTLFLLISSVANAASFTAVEMPKSKYLAKTPKVTVALPASYSSNSSKRYPVLYLLDGELNGELVHGMLQRLHASNGSYEHIIVGITSQNRIRDFAPTVNQDPRGPVGEGGGGDAFLDFIEKELMPTIAENYRTGQFNSLAGHSIAGLLVLHSFQSRPALFQSFLAFSPAVWWGARETAEATKKYVSSQRRVQNYLYMNIGSEGGEMREVYDSLAHTILRNRHLDAKLQLDEFDDQSHDFTLAVGLYNALKGLFQYQQQQKGR
ncbi:alpha/beta hydrolase-fold protein [Pseudoalteromonas sp. McH1-42]|uniref:alpha/beta hydrolase n=1 Tax=Pseudoalteromonas sp. McH1-42 TaxID=2917752 RepID=UPI001EF6634D|nr:alpha/beta hydrolase-fold protein [Pseudoalteromonas sp. McH1-42]MCG7562447.1 alpha/beta hydrolase [Pseudoalteromonas sp. McH1-42]